MVSRDWPTVPSKERRLGSANADAGDDFVDAESGARSESQVDASIRAGAEAQRLETHSERRCGRDCSRKTATQRLHTRERAPAQPVIHVFRSDCQQTSAHPSERNAAWMSARLSYRTRRRRN